MPGKPTAERPPTGLTAYWLGVWRCALKTLQDQGTWAFEQRPLLDEYVYALVAAEQARIGFGWLEQLGDVACEPVDFVMLAKIAGGLPAQWNTHTKRAAALADQLMLTPRGRKAVGLGSSDDAEKPADPFAAIDAGRDELAPRRRSA